MIQDLDRTLELLLRDRVPLHDAAVSFDTPNDAFRPTTATALTVDVFLYDMRENHDLRTPEWTFESQPDGRVLKQRPKARIDLCYMITAWSGATPRPDVLTEHALLSQILRTLLRYPSIPADLLQGALIGQEPPLPTLVAQPDGMRNPSEFWGALRQSPRPGVHTVVTIAVQPSALGDEPVRLRPAISVERDYGQAGGLVYQLDIRPPLAGSFAAGTPVRRMGIDSSPPRGLAQPVFASAAKIQCDLVAPLPSRAWVLIDDAANREFARLGEITAPGEQEVVVTPPLRFAHDAAPDRPIPLRAVIVPEPDAVATTLTGLVEAGVALLPIARSEGLATDDVLLISDGGQTEAIQVTEVTPASGGTDASVKIQPALRFPHAAGRNLYRRTLAPPPADPKAASRLVRPVRQNGSSIVPDKPIAAEVDLMVGAGPEVEFCRTTGTAAAGAPVSVAPPLRGNHAERTPLRSLSEGELIGELHLAASREEARVVMVGRPEALEGARRRGQPLVNAGDLLRLGEPAPLESFQVTAGQTAPGALQGQPEAFISIGGRVVDSSAPPHPVVGATVTLRDTGLVATTDAAGRFVFANLLPGEYALAVAAAGYADATKRVQVPPPTAVKPEDGGEEYTVVLSA